MKCETARTRLETLAFGETETACDDVEVLAHASACVPCGAVAVELLVLASATRPDPAQAPPPELADHVFHEIGDPTVGRSSSSPLPCLAVAAAVVLGFFIGTLTVESPSAPSPFDSSPPIVVNAPSVSPSRALRTVHLDPHDYQNGFFSGRTVRVGNR
ncbi:MAG: hypothetical protein CMJ83_07825 [Planctomycetes bacterium]|nr:hypothetical protein [Planctomycetota bacterium]